MPLNIYLLQSPIYTIRHPKNTTQISSNKQQLYPLEKLHYYEKTYNERKKKDLELSGERKNLPANLSDVPNQHMKRLADVSFTRSPPQSISSLSLWCYWKKIMGKIAPTYKVDCVSEVFCFSFLFVGMLSSFLKELVRERG